MDHRAQFWQWLVFGFRRLTLMVEEFAQEVPLPPEQAEQLADFARRLLVVAGRAKG